jgi:hypothetical protein
MRDKNSSKSLQGFANSNSNLQKQIDAIKSSSSSSSSSATLNNDTHGGSGVKIESGKIVADVDNTTLDITSEKIGIKTDGISASHLSTNCVSGDAIDMDSIKGDGLNVVSNKLKLHYNTGHFTYSEGLGLYVKNGGLNASLFNASTWGIGVFPGTSGVVDVRHGCSDRTPWSNFSTVGAVSLNSNWTYITTSADLYYPPQYMIETFNYIGSLLHTWYRIHLRGKVKKISGDWVLSETVASINTAAYIPFRSSSWSQPLYDSDSTPSRRAHLEIAVHGRNWASLSKSGLITLSDLENTISGTSNFDLSSISFDTLA